MKAHDRFDDVFSQVHYLATATFHGDATDEEMRQLERLVVDNDAARGMYVDFIEVYQSLQTWAASEDVKQCAKQRIANAAGSDDECCMPNEDLAQVTPHSWWSSRTLRHPKFLALSSATLVIGVVLMAMALVAPPFFRAVVDRDSIETPEFVAQVTRTLDCRWSEEDAGLSLGTRLPAGRRLVLEHGIAEVTFRSGASVIVQGPATFVVASQLDSSLKDGRITVNVPETAHGFTVETSLGRVVDLGTQFGIWMDRKQEAAQVHTFAGQVQLEVPGATDEKPTIRLLQAGDAVKLSSTQPPEKMKIDEAAFVRNLAPSPQNLPGPTHQWTFNDGTANDLVGSAHGQLASGATIADGRLHLDGGPHAVMRTASLEDEISEKTLVSWVSLHTLDQAGGSILTLESNNGEVFDGIVFGERTPLQWMSGSNTHQRSPPDNYGAAESWRAPQVIMMAIVYHLDGSILIYRNGVIYAAYRSGPPPKYPGGGARAIFGQRHSTANDWQMAASIDEARIYSFALSPAQIRQLYEIGATR